MKYPQLANWVVLEKINQNTTKLYDAISDETYFTDSSEFIKFVTSLDGYTDPYATESALSRREISAGMKELTHHSLLRTSRVAFKWFGNLGVTLYVPRNSSVKHIISLFLNYCLIFLFLPVLLIGAYLYWEYALYYETTALPISGVLIGILLGSFFHEMGHAIACWAYKGKVFEFGFGFNNFLPSFYTMMYIKQIKLSKAKVIQINAAGIEANGLLAGVLLGLTVILPGQSLSLLIAASINIFMMFINLSFIDGFDGLAIISTLFDVDDLADKAISIVFDSRKREWLLEQGYCGLTAYIVCVIISIMQLVIPCAIILNISGVIGWLH